MKRLTTAAVIVAAAAAAAVPAGVAGAAKSKTRTVKIGDNFFNPSKLTVKVGTTVRWKWPEETGDTHDVKLKSGPKGVKKFHSEEAGSAYSFRRRLTKPGTYKIICTLHADMRETIVVKR